MNGNYDHKWPHTKLSALIKWKGLKTECLNTIEMKLKISYWDCVRGSFWSVLTWEFLGIDSLLDHFENRFFWAHLFLSFFLMGDKMSKHLELC